MGTSSLNIHFGWVGILCLFSPMELSFAGVPLKVWIRLANIYFFHFHNVHSYIKIELYIKVNAIQTLKNQFWPNKFITYFKCQKINFYQTDSNFWWYPCKAEFHWSKKTLTKMSIEQARAHFMIISNFTTSKIVYHNLFPICTCI